MGIFTKKSKDLDALQNAIETRRTVYS
ncbi:nitroreductase family protein, partial [Staphylococcus nepalensis]